MGSMTIFLLYLKHTVIIKKGINNMFYHVIAVSLEEQKTSIPSASLFKAKKQTLKTKSEQEVQAPPLKKVRRVLPEHEGRYKITMPSGSTPRTQKILAKQGLCKYQCRRNGTVLSVFTIHIVHSCLLLQ